MEHTVVIDMSAVEASIRQGAEASLMQAISAQGGALGKAIADYLFAEQAGKTSWAKNTASPFALICNQALRASVAQQVNNWMLEHAEEITAKIDVTCKTLMESPEFSQLMRDKLMSAVGLKPAMDDDDDDEG